jgi:hypothetical protein
MNLFKSFDSSIGKNSRKAAHPSGGVGSSNPRRWRGERLHHHGDGVWCGCAFCVVLTRDCLSYLSYVRFGGVKVIHLRLHHTIRIPAESQRNIFDVPTFPRGMNSGSA